LLEESRRRGELHAFDRTLFGVFHRGTSSWNANTRR
jgi:hypothetical protein